jgi:3-oxoacyl-[acyl-carrier-protein] synthase II
MARSVVITGAGLISTLGDSPRAFHRALCEGSKGVRSLQQFTSNGHRCRVGAPISDFRPEKYLQGRPLRPLDRTSQLAASAAQLALRDSGWSADLLANREVSLALGTMFGGIRTIAEFDRSALHSGPTCASAMAFANTVINAAAGQTAIWHNLRGVNATIAAGTISGLLAIGYAADLIRFGTLNAMLAGGADEFCFESFHAFSQAGFLCGDTNGGDLPVPFDTRRNGFALAEGAAFLMLEDEDSARARGARILAEIRGNANAFDCSGGRDCDSAARAIARAITETLLRADVTPNDVDFLSSSANGSILRDCYESVAVEMAFKDCARHLPVTAIKGGTGEALGASGPLQAIAAIETLRQGMLPGISDLQDLAPDFPLRGAAAETREISARCGLLNAVGLDGNACAMVISAIDG